MLAMFMGGAGGGDRPFWYVVVDGPNAAAVVDESADLCCAVAQAIIYDFNELYIP